MKYERVISIGHDHPSLAGHFPGHPIVPGVVLITEVLETLRCGLAAAPSVTELPMVKFSSPLLPGELVSIEVDQDATAHATFSCRVERRLIASGVIKFLPGSAVRVEGV